MLSYIIESSKSTSANSDGPIFNQKGIPESKKGRATRRILIKNNSSQLKKGKVKEITHELQRDIRGYFTSRVHSIAKLKVNSNSTSQDDLEKGVPLLPAKQRSASDGDI